MEEASPPYDTRRIEPREDEGCEALPPYSCSIMIRNVFVRKMELERAIHRASDRNWYKVFVELQGTALRVYKTKGDAASMKGHHEISADAPSWLRPAELINTYSLQHADVGVAADYLKRRYVIRVRVEGEQFLLACVEIETFLLWLESLSAAIDLAPPLDERNIPKDQKMPRSRRTRRAANGATIVTTATFNPAVPERTSTRDELRRTFGLRPRPTPARHSSTSSAFSSSSSLSDDGKWQPTHAWSPIYDLMYARRCMTVLLDKSPRKTNLIIMKGKQFVVDWTTGALTRCEPPEYGEVQPIISKMAASRLKT